MTAVAAPGRPDGPSRGRRRWVLGAVVAVWIVVVLVLAVFLAAVDIALSRLVGLILK